MSLHEKQEIKSIVSEPMGYTFCKTRLNTQWEKPIGDIISHRSEDQIRIDGSYFLRINVPQK